LGVIEDEVKSWPFDIRPSHMGTNQSRCWSKFLTTKVCGADRGSARYRAVSLLGVRPMSDSFHPVLESQPSNRKRRFL
jgi:hypothetical protein